LSRHHGEVLVAAGVIAVEMRVDEILHGQRRDRLDSCFNFLGQRRELPIHHDDAVAANRNGDVPACAFEHVGVVAEIGGFDLDLRPVDQRRHRHRRLHGGLRERGSGDHGCHSGECESQHSLLPYLF